MAELRTDRDLLREYTENGSESAFQLLVQRHVNLVFATTMRGLNDAATAQEITQNVFVALARKAAWLRGETNLACWLHKTALLEVRHWWRGELRRQRREQTAAELGTVMKDEDSLLKPLTGELDEGLMELRQSDRQALMLRYFEGHTHREIGALLGAREDAIRMRIDKALEQLTRFFRRRGYAVPAAAAMATVLGSAVKAAPAGLSVVVARSALTASGSGALTGLKLLLARLMGLTKAQTTAFCLALAAAPVAWELNANRVASKQNAEIQSWLNMTRTQEADASAEVERLRAESLRLDTSIADALKTQARYQNAALRLDALKGRVQALLSDPNYHWPGDSPYVRVPKSVVKSLDLLHRPPMAFGPSGELSEPALELFAITPQEKAPTEATLASYWHGADELATAAAYETNLPSAEAGRFTKTVVVPPLGQPLKTLAEETRGQLTDTLGPEREQLLFAGWDEGGIQLFSPGNLWKISEQPQTFSVWVEPAQPGENAARYGVSRYSTMGGMSSQDASSLGILPRPIAARFFDPWLAQFGINH